MSFSLLTPPNGAFSASLLVISCVLPAILSYHYSSSRGRRSAKPPTSGLTTMADVRVSKILVHPIKSCRGISVQRSRYTPEGLEHDRRWCIIEGKDQTVITAREFPKMVLITPQIEADPESPNSGVLSVSFPEESGCEPFSVPLCPNQTTLDSWILLPKILMWHVPFDAYIAQQALPSSDSRSPSEILSSYFGRPVDLVFKGAQPRPCDPTATHPQLEAKAVFQDCFPLMVLSEESTARVEEELRGHVGTQGIDERWKTERLVIERFRPNIVFQGAGPFTEDSWQEIRIGSLPDAPIISMVSKCTRCLLPNVDPEKGERDKAVPYKTLMKFRKGFDPQNKMKACLGCNGVPLGVGWCEVGDAVAARV